MAAADYLSVDRIAQSSAIAPPTTSHPSASVESMVPVSAALTRVETLLQRAGCSSYKHLFAVNGVQDEFLDVLDAQGCESAHLATLCLNHCLRLGLRLLRCRGRTV
jgi:hypothetical protein